VSTPTIVFVIILFCFEYFFWIVIIKYLFERTFSWKIHLRAPVRPLAEKWDGTIMAVWF
jgi:hypothetical protein